MVAIAQRRARRRQQCFSCGGYGHNQRTCTGPRKALYRCTLCGAMAWGTERAMHLYDHHRMTARPDRLGEFFQECEKDTGSFDKE